VRPPLDEDPLFHLWLLQVSIACSLTFNLFDAAVDGLPGYILLILASGFVLLGVYMRMRKKPSNHACGGRNETMRYNTKRKVCLFRQLSHLKKV